MKNNKILYFFSITLLIQTVLAFCFISTSCTNNKNIVTLNGVQYEKIIFTRDGISTEAYQVIGCDEDITNLKIENEVSHLSVLGFKRYAFENNTNLKEIVLPDTITNIPLSSAPFKGCTNIEKITCATDDIMNLFTDDGKTDNNRKETIPESVKYIYLTNACTKIETRMLYYCSNIEQLHIPISVETIVDGTNYTTIPSNGNQITSSKFNNLPFIGCTKLVIYCEAIVKPKGWGEYWNYINEYTQAPVFWATGNNIVDEDIFE